MKVLHINAGNLYGGVETYLVTLAKARHLVPEMEPHFALCFPGRLREELLEAGVSVRDLGGVRVSRPWKVLRARRRLAHLLAHERYDWVICQMPWSYGLFGGLIRSRGVHVAAHFHGPANGGWVEWLAARQQPDLLLAPSQHTLATHRSTYPGTPAGVLHNPLPPHVTDTPELPLEERAAIRARLGAAPEDVVILSATRIEPWKGPDRLLSALARLRHLPRWKCWLAGGVQRPQEQPYYESLFRDASAAGLSDHIAFLGHRRDVSLLMRSADIYSQGNRGPEGFSLAFLEASYCGLPVVTTHLGGAPEMIDASTGVLVPPTEDVGPLAEALCRLITNPRQRSDMGANAREKAIRLCAPRQQLQRLADFLRRTVEGPALIPHGDSGAAAAVEGRLPS